MSEIQKYTPAQIAQIDNVKKAAYVKRVADAAAKFYAAQDDHQTAQQAKEISMRSARRAGQILSDVPREERKRTDLSGDTTGLQTIIEDAGIGETTAKRWQQVARVPEDKFEVYFTEAEYKNWEYSIASLMRFAGLWYQRSDIAEWGTPQWFFDLLDDEFHFDLDVCASPDNAKCPRYYTKEDDALQQEWQGNCWMNPPYGREIKEWMAKARRSAEDGALMVCLVPARPDTEWWWDNCIEGEIRFIKGRLQWPPDDTTAPFPSAVVVLNRERISKGGTVKWWNAKIGLA